MNTATKSALYRQLRVEESRKPKILLTASDDLTLDALEAEDVLLLLLIENFLDVMDLRFDTWNHRLFESIDPTGSLLDLLADAA